VSNDDGRISNIAHYFLSDIKSEKVRSEKLKASEMIKESWSPRISRVAPNGTKITYSPHQMTDQSLPKVDPSRYDISSASDDQGTEPDISDEKCRILRVISPPQKNNEPAATIEFAKTLATAGQDVGVLTMCENSLSFCYYSLSENTVDLIEDESDSNFYRLLKNHMQTLGYLLINVEGNLPGYEKRLAQQIGDVCVCTSPERDHLVRSYQLIKYIKDLSKSIGLFVANVEGFSVAQAVFQKIADTAHEHLNLEIENYGYPLHDDTVFCHSPGNMKIDGPVEKWFAGFEEWLREVNPDQPAADKISGAISDKTDLSDIGFDLEKESLHVTETITPAIQEQKKERQPQISELIGLRMIDISTTHSYAETVGNIILLNSSLVKDSLYQFLNSADFDCGRFENTDGKGTLIIVLLRDNDSTGLDWMLEHYPYKDDRLIIVSDQAMGRMERSRWTKYFTNVELRRLIRAQFDGRDVYILE
jgi:hypothetical protein